MTEIRVESGNWGVVAIWLLHRTRFHYKMHGTKSLPILATTSIAKAKPGPNLICIACSAMTGLWSAGCVFARFPREDAARRSGECTAHPVTQSSHVEHRDWLKKVQKHNLGGDHGHGHSNKTWLEVIQLDCLALDLSETHTFNRRAWSCQLKSTIRQDLPYTRE